MLPMYEIRKTELTVKKNRYSLEFPEHMHKYIELIYVLKGKQTIRFSGNTYTLTPGTAALILPDIVHSYSRAECEENEILILIAAPKLFGALLPDLKNIQIRNPIIKPEYITDELRTALEMIAPEQSFEVKFAWSCVIMAYIMGILKTEFHYVAPVEDISFKIIKYIEENFSENITRKSIAHYFGVSECYISRIFSEKLKMDFRNYLGLMRSEYAAQLIRSTDSRFEAIAQMAGFGSFRTFSRTFKEVYGMTPREYKNSIYKFINH